MRKYVLSVRAIVTTAIISAMSLPGCGSSHAPARSAGNCVKNGVRTGVAGAKTGVKTGVEGVKTAGKTVGGLFEGGSDEARRKWQEGKADTKRTAHEGAAETKGESEAPDCP